MIEGDVLQVLDVLEDAGVQAWIDGGWGVDALLGRRTREHRDLDLVVLQEQLERARCALEAVGYTWSPKERPGLPARLPLTDGHGLRVDLHPVVFDKWGNGWQRLGVRAWGLYPSQGLTTTGTIGERHVRCVSAETQLRHHLGYEWDAEDEQDIVALAEHFDLPLPPR
jgi:lincosamide nucleotidyltransferase A/C/D/E